jgi:hypothetical protein
VTRAATQALPPGTQLALAGTPPVARVKALVAGPVQTVWLPIRTVSEANRASHEHWRVRQRRAKAQREAAALCMWATLGKPPALPVKVHLTRVAPSAGLDPFENLPSALKHVVDGVADWLGIDDRDPGVAWSCGQARGEPKQYGVRVEVTAGAAPAAEGVSWLLGGLDTDWRGRPFGPVGDLLAIADDRVFLAGSTTPQTAQVRGIRGRFNLKGEIR